MSQMVYGEIQIFRETPRAVLRPIICHLLLEKPATPSARMGNWDPGRGLRERRVVKLPPQPPDSRPPGPVDMFHVTAFFPVSV